MTQEMNATVDDTQCVVIQNFKIGQFLEIAGRVLEIFSITEQGNLVLRDVQQGEHRTISAQNLRELLNESSLQPVDEMPKIPVGHPNADTTNAPWLAPEEVGAGEVNIKALKVMNQKMTWVKALQKRMFGSLRPSAEASRMLKEVERVRGEKSPFTVGTLYRASLSLVKSGGEARALRPKFDMRGGRGRSRLDPKIEAVLDAELEKVKAQTKVKLNVARVCQAVEKNITTCYPGLAAPARPTIERRLHEMFTQYEWVLRTKGKDAAEAMFRNSHSRIRADAPLSVVQFDDTDTRIFLISEHNGLPWGRAWLTAGIDEYTGAVLGVDISEQPRSTESAYRAFMNAVMPLNFTKPEFSLVKSRTDYYGHIGLVVMDNALYNHATALEASIRNMGSEIMYAKPKTPTEKPDIEYLNKKMKEDFVPYVPGALIGVDRLAQLSQAADGAVLTVSAFQKLAYHWLFDHHNNTPGPDGNTPNQKWLMEFENHRPLLPKCLPSIGVRMDIPKLLRLRSSGGIARLGLRYNSDPLQEIRRVCGGNAQLEIRYNTNDLTYISVLNPITNTYLKVPCINSPDFTVGLTNRQLQLIRKYCITEKIKNPSIAQLMVARNEMQVEVKKLLESDKMSKRKKGVIASGDKAQLSSKEIAQKRPDEIVNSKSEKSKVELWMDTINKNHDQEAEDEDWD